MSEENPDVVEEAYKDSVFVEKNIFERFKDSVGGLLHDIRHTKGAARIDVIGKIGLFIPAFTSVLIITLILSLLWLESAPILTNPDYGIPIIWDPVWRSNQDQYGILPYIIGTITCSLIAIIIAVPLGVLGAIFLSEFCPVRYRMPFRVVIELMAAIPSIVYGLWAYNSLRPLVSWLAAIFGIGGHNGTSLLTGGMILGIMLLPTVTTISDDALRSVPRTYREASYALGATQSETARKVVLSAALPGVGAAVVLSLGRAIGETMAVLMVSGNSLNIPDSVFDRVYLMTSVIAQQLGTAYVDPLWRSALFTVGLVLMLMSILFTLIAKLIIRWGMKTRGYK